MDVDLLRNSFFLAAVVAAVLGVVVGGAGLSALSMRHTGSVVLGALALLCVAATCALSVGATQRDLETSAMADLARTSPSLASRLSRVLAREARTLSGLGAALSMPALVLGLISVVGAAVSSSSTRPRRMGEAEHARAGAPSLVGVAATVFGVLALLALGAALVSWRRRLPEMRPPLSEDDGPGWQVAEAVDRVFLDGEHASACGQLEAALVTYAGELPATWPRSFRRWPPEVIDWRAASHQCVVHILSKPPGALAWSREGLRTSPLVVTEEDFARVSGPPPTPD